MYSNRLLLCYNGSMNRDMVSALLQFSEECLRTEQTISKRIRKGIINILIECLQNVAFHGIDAKLPNSKNCLLILAKDGSCFHVITGNLIPADVKNKLQERIDALNLLSREELHRKYLDTLEQGRLSEKGGAGLGIMRILREATSKIDYQFTEVSPSVTFFSMKVSVDVTN